MEKAAQNSRNFKINLEHISISLKVSYKWFPLHLMSKFYAIHSPNTFPSGNDMSGFDYRTMTGYCEFNQISIQFLSNSYDTNCYEYDLDYKFANFNMRSDCIQSCIQNYIGIGCNNQNLFLAVNYMFGKNRIVPDYISINDMQLGWTFRIVLRPFLSYNF